MNLLQKLEQARANKKQDADSKPGYNRTNPDESVLHISEKPNNEKKYSQILESHFPNAIPQDVCISVVGQIKALPSHQQTEAWLALSKWLTTGAGDIEWRCSVFEQLSDAWDLRDARPDFLMAKDIFRGTGSRVILDGQTIRNRGTSW